MKTLINFISLQILSFFTTHKKRFVVYKYGPKADICIITGKKIHGKKCLSFQTSYTGGLIQLSKGDKKVCSKVRKFVGENVLTIFGPPPDGETAPNIVLYPTFSALWVLGFFGYRKFKKEWTGNSEVNDITVITYSLK